MNTNLFLQFFLYLMIVSFFFCTKKVNTTSIQINQNKNLQQFWKESHDSQKKLPFSFKNFTFNSDTNSQVFTIENLNKPSDVQGRFYIFKLFNDPLDRLTFTPTLPEDLNNISLGEWFKEHILPIIIKKNSILHKYKLENDKYGTSMRYHDVSILENKCDITIVPKGEKQNPMFFVYLWHYSNRKNIDNERIKTEAIERWSNKRIESSLSIKEANNIDTNSL